jgi:hypothetical protein
VADPEVKKITTWMHVTDEMIVDFRIGTEEQQAAAAARLEAARARRAAAWRALPARVRIARTLRARRWDLEERIRSAIHRRLFPECDRG